MAISTGPNRNDVAKTLMAMANLFGKNLNEASVDLLLMDLEDYSTVSILKALAGCRKELQRFPLVSDIISRIEAQDGRPGAEEAWSILPKNEDDSAFVTDEMRSALGVAYALQDDEIAARMAFKEKYVAEVSRARREKLPVKWTPIFGRSTSSRAAAISKAMNQNLISHIQACDYAIGFEHLLSHKDRIAIGKQKPAIVLEGPQVTADEVKALVSKTFKDI